MKTSNPISRLAGFLLLTSLLPCSNEVPMFTPAAAQTLIRTEAPEEATACDVIRARIRQVTRQLRRALANGNTSLARKLRRQLRTLRRRLAICQATPPAPFLEMVTVGNPGNAADQDFGDGQFGVVANEYKIGKFEVTLAQYAAFLNAVASTDAFGLYSGNMAIDLNSAGIAQNGIAGSFSYSVIGTGTRPVTFVSWFDAARFCNWLHNGRPTGAQDATTTERGAYTLDGVTSGGLTITRNPEAKYWIPSEDEWYKAAYHQPAGDDGDADDYWLYPTRSNSAPGNTIGPLPLVNHANHRTTVYSVTQIEIRNPDQNYLTAVGSYPGSVGFYGTHDQGGNVFEWNDAVITGTSRGLRGGTWANSENFLRSSSRNNNVPSLERSSIGFRVASP